MTNSFRQLSMDERRIIAQMVHNKVSQSQIARSLGRDRSTIHCETKRNFWHDKEYPLAESYWHVTAQSLAEKRRRSYRKLHCYPSLRDALIDRLKAGWSPEQISGRLRMEPDSPLRICHETIYHYVHSEEGCQAELARLLPGRRRKRRPRHARRARGLVFPEQMAIKNRPDVINRRDEFGHWEGDLMIFSKKHGQANIAKIVERKSRYTVPFRNNDRRSKPIMDRIVSQLSSLPRFARQSITFDRGFEFVSWRELYKGMGMESWFYDPQAPWQKGSVENMNKRVRRYLPRDTVLLSLPPSTIDTPCKSLNATPRKCLGFKTPAEVFNNLLMEPDQKMR